MNASMMRAKVALQSLCFWILSTEVDFWMTVALSVTVCEIVGAEVRKGHRATASTKAVETKDKKTAEVFKSAQSTVDKMASKGIVHKNKAARIKSRLNKQVKSA